MTELTIPLSNLEIPPSIVAKQAALFDAFLAMSMQGLTLNQALESAGVPASNYYRWRRAHPEWIAGLQAQAEGIAAAATQQRVLELATKRQAIQRRIDDTVLEASSELVQKLLTIAQGGSQVLSLKAIIQLRAIAKEGFVAPIERPQTEEDDEAAALPTAAYNPYIPIAKGELTLTDGTQITIKGPDVVEGDVL